MKDRMGEKEEDVEESCVMAEEGSRLANEEDKRAAFSDFGGVGGVIVGGASSGIDLTGSEGEVGAIEADRI